MYEHLVPYGPQCCGETGCCPFWEKADRPGQDHGFCHRPNLKDGIVIAPAFVFENQKECGINL